jgi:hypothetical protein
VPSNFEFTNSLGQNFSLPFVKIKFELKQGIAHCEAHLLFLSMHWAADSLINVTGPGSVGQISESARRPRARHSRCVGRDTAGRAAGPFISCSSMQPAISVRASARGSVRACVAT